MAGRPETTCLHSGAKHGSTVLEGTVRCWPPGPGVNRSVQVAQSDEVDDGSIRRFLYIEFLGEVAKTSYNVALHTRKRPSLGSLQANTR